MTPPPPHTHTQGYSFTHPKCTASKLLQLATELQKLKEEFYTGGNYTCDPPPPPHTHTQGYSFTHPKCTASKLLQLATELQKLKEEFYTGGNYTCDPPPHHTHTHRATASHTPNVRPTNYYSWLPNYRNSRRSSIPEVIIHVTPPPPPPHTHTQGYSFTHPKCTASKLLQLATELQKLKEEFYTGGNYTCDPPPPPQMSLIWPLFPIFFKIRILLKITTSKLEFKQVY